MKLTETKHNNEKLSMKVKRTERLRLRVRGKASYDKIMGGNKW